MSLHQRHKLRAGTTIRYVLDYDREQDNLDHVFLLRVLSVDSADDLSAAIQNYVSESTADNYRAMLDIAVAGHEVPDCEGCKLTEIITKPEGMELIKACRDANSLNADERKNYESQHTSQVEKSASDAGADVAKTE